MSAVPEPQATALSLVTLQASDDEVKTDLEVTCSECGEHLCDAEAGDSLLAIADTALDHWEAADHAGL